MKSCPHCNEPPQWHYCSNVSRARKVVHFAFVGCRHAEEFRGAQFYTTPMNERAAYEAKWDAHCEQLFAAYTSGPRWDEPSRIAFAARLWPVVAPVVPAELFISAVGGNEIPSPAFRHNVEPTDDCPWDENQR